MRDLARSTCYVGFANRFESVDALGILLANLHHLSKGPFPNHFEEVERVDGESFMPSGLIRNGKME